MTDYLTVADVLAIHEDQIERYGGSHGIRDPGQLEAALFRMQSGYYEDVIAEAAALWESLSQNHPFIDGNKRTAFACAYTFLAINSIEITTDAKSTYEFLEGLSGC
jgi:death-on-curing protein